MHWFGLIGFVVFSLVTAGGSSRAQQQPPTIDPGIVEERVRPPAVPRTELPEIVVPDVARQAPPPGAEEQTFTLRGLIVDGNAVFSDAELAPIWEPYLGEEIPLAQLWDFRAQITVKYRNAGYILSQAVVPAQEIDNGIARIEIIEGFIDDVIIEGEPSGALWQFQEKIEEIKAARPLRAAVLERYMLLINDLPGVTAQSVLRPSPVEPGASELVIFVEERRFGGSIGVDSYGSQFLGPYEATGLAVANNLYGLYDSTELRALITFEVEELQFVALTHNVPITSEGTVLSLSGSYTNTAPGSTLEELDIDGESYAFSLFASHPFIRTRSQNLSVVGGFRTRDTESEFAGTPDFEDAIRAVSAGATFDFIDRLRGINLLTFEVSQGLDILGARGRGATDPGPSRENGRVDFTKVNASVLREQFLFRGWSLLAAARGQFSFSQLLSAEQFGFGGEEFGRGYDAFEIAGDRGLAAKAQLQYGSSTTLDFLDSYQVYAFYDTGVVWQIDDDLPNPRESASSAGVGAVVNLAFDITGKLEIGIPLNRDPINPELDEDEPRVLFRFAKRL